VFWENGTKIDELRPVKRWTARIFYDDPIFPDDGPGEPFIHRHEFEELSELHGIVERGLNFYSVAKIEIVINPAIDRKELMK
jgi:hypothetical protein